MQPELVTALDAMADEMACCEHLAGLLEDQREALLARDEQRMVETAEAVVVHVEQLRGLAPARRQALADLSAALDLATQGLSLDAIAAALPGPERQVWYEAGSRARHAVRRVADLSELNGEIAQDGLACARAELRLLSGDALEPSYLGAPGTSPARRSVPLVMDKSA